MRLCFALMASSAVVLGCSTWGSQLGGEPDASVDGTADAAPADAGVDAVATDAPPSNADGGPIIADLKVTPNPNNVLAATVTFTTGAPTTDEVVVTNVGDGGAHNSFSVPLSGSPATTSHSIPILGMRASSPFRIDVKTTDAARRSATASADYTTAALPSVIPPVEVLLNDKTRTSPGYTMLDLWAWTGTQPFADQDGSRSSIVIVDDDGQIVWYYLGGSVPVDPTKLPNGDLLFLSGGTPASWTEVDMMGNQVRNVAASVMGLATLSHAITPEQGTDDHLSIAPELRRISGYPTADGGTTTYSVVGDIIAEFDSDGGVLNEWSTFDMLDPHYEGDTASFNNPFWNFVYRDAGATKDWTHGNAVVTDPSDGTIVASSRTLSWIYKFDRDDGGAPKLLWRLGPNGDFTLTNPKETFQYNQHGAYVLPDGHIMAFDNGDDRPADAGVGGLFSRAIEYSLDTSAMQATIVWQYREWPPFYSQFLGSSYLLPNGNVLICDGGEVAMHGDTYKDPANLKYGRVMEVTHDARPTKVMELDVNVPITWDSNFSGFSVYRAKRISSLY